MSKAMSSDPITPSPRIEVITSVQRRRRWSTTEKVRLVEEAMQPGSSVSFVARRYGRGEMSGRCAAGFPAEARRVVTEHLAVLRWLG